MLVAGFLVDAAGLVVKVGAPNVAVLALGLLFVTLGSNVSAAAYQAYVPDVVPQSQYGEQSSYIGAATMLGTLAIDVLSDRAFAAINLRIWGISTNLPQAGASFAAGTLPTLLAPFGVATGHNRSYNAPSGCGRVRGCEHRLDLDTSGGTLTESDFERRKR